LSHGIRNGSAGGFAVGIRRILGAHQIANDSPVLNLTRRRHRPARFTSWVAKQTPSLECRERRGDWDQARKQPL